MAIEKGIYSAPEGIEDEEMEMEGHRISAVAWSKLGRAIEIELSLHDQKRKNCRDFLKVCRAEYDNLLESSPNIDLDIINMFNKKFEDKYPNVRKPIICNGLKEIKPFVDDTEPAKPASTSEETAEPEPIGDLEYVSDEPLV